MSATERARLRENCEKALVSGDRAKNAGASAILEALSAFERATSEAERVRLDSLSDAERIYEIFRKEPLTEHEAKLIRALLDRPAATPAELNAAVNYEGGWYIHFGKMARRRLAHVIQAPLYEKERDEYGNPKSFWTGILADWDEHRRVYIMKPAAREAFARLGLRPATKFNAERKLECP